MWTFPLYKYMTHCFGLAPSKRNNRHTAFKADGTSYCFLFRWSHGLLCCYNGRLPCYDYAVYFYLAVLGLYGGSVFILLDPKYRSAALLLCVLYLLFGLAMLASQTSRFAPQTDHRTHILSRVFNSDSSTTVLTEATKRNFLKRGSYFLIVTESFEKEMRSLS